VNRWNMRNETEVNNQPAVSGFIKTIHGPLLKVTVCAARLEVDLRRSDLAICVVLIDHGARLRAYNVTMPDDDPVLSRWTPGAIP
jgi:hypothetical protein